MGACPAVPAGRVVGRRDRRRWRLLAAVLPALPGVDRGSAAEIVVGVVEPCALEGLDGEELQAARPSAPAAADGGRERPPARGRGGAWADKVAVRPPARRRGPAAGSGGPAPMASVTNLRPHVRRPVRPPRADLDPPAGQGAHQRGRPRRGAQGDPHRAARGRRRAERRPPLLRRHPAAGQHRGALQEPHPGPAGHPGRARGAGQRPRRRDAQAHATRPARRPSSSWPACRARARPPTRPSSPCGGSSRGATRCWSAPTSSARPPSSSCASSASRPGVTVFSEPTDPVALRRGGPRGGPAARQGHLHHRHGGPPHHRRRADGADPGHLGGDRSPTTRSSSSTP